MKCAVCLPADDAGGSPPTRGAWIEIGMSRIGRNWSGVAPHTGGVD